jgi:hypothetical protein
MIYVLKCTRVSGCADIIKYPVYAPELPFAVRVCFFLYFLMTCSCRHSGSDKAWERQIFDLPVYEYEERHI